MVGAGPGWTVHKRECLMCVLRVSGVSSGQAQGQCCKKIIWVVLLTPVNSTSKLPFTITCEYREAFYGSDKGVQWCFVQVKHNILHLHLDFFEYLLRFTMYIHMC